MSKTVKLGSPARVWGIMFRPMLISLAILQVWLFGVYMFVGTEKGLDWLIDHLYTGGSLFLILPIILFPMYSFVLASRAKRYQKRFKQRRGLVCFVCDYDMLEGQHTCPECGSKWEPERLGKGWKKMMREASD